MPEIIAKPKKNSRLQLALVVLIPSIAMGMAWLMYFTGLGVPDGRTNKGELLLPPAQFSALNLQDGDATVDPDDTEGLWRVVVFGSTRCNESQCQESLYKTRQVHIALGKDADRITRFYIAPGKPEPSDQLESEHPGIYWLKADNKNIQKTLGLLQWPENRIFIIDPFGNLIMGYQVGQPGGDLLKDLKKLLKASNIG
ncbi:hypothetical protein [Endozoicomonas sp.]|uniref:hypothetical protein n=1 Tax=Endozoicomonas sp. TaxID=1892382 RepID=UPI00383A5727